MEQIFLNGINLEQLLDEIDKVIQKRLADIPINNTPIERKFLTRKEVASLLRISLPTLHEWTLSGFLLSHKIGSRVLFKPEEVEHCLKKRGDVRTQPIISYKNRKNQNS